jgi:hypothetical protein
MRLLLASLLAATAFTACTPVEDELATEDTTELSDEKADAIGTYTYYTVRSDFRRCAFPFCGGFWVERLNRTTTKCFDGTYAEACYVADADWTKLGLEADVVDAVNGSARGGTLVVRATIKAKDYGTGSRLGQLRPTEAWIGQGPGEPDGVFVKVEETGVRCFTTPCPFFREHKLNGSGTAALAELGWDAAGLPEDSELIGDAITELFENNLIISGDRYTVRGPGGTGKARSVTQFYVRATDLR